MEIENASGAGAWVIIENMENLNEREMRYLISKINLELQNSITSAKFKIWISVSLNSSYQDTISNDLGADMDNGCDDEKKFKRLNFFCKTKECSNLMKDLAKSSWKIFVNEPTNLSICLEHFFNIESQEYKAYRDQKNNSYKSNLK